MPRINATRSEHAKRRAKALRASRATADAYAVPGVWEAERASLQAELDAAIKNGNEKDAMRAKNGLLVLKLYQPK